MPNNMRTDLPKAENVTKDIRMPGSVSNTNDGVDVPINSYVQQNKRWKMTRALMEGTDAMRAAEQEFLPKEPAESSTAYDNRLARSVLFGAYKKTITTSTGRPFSRPMQFDKFAPQLLALNDNIDLQGNNIDVLARHTFLSGLAHGHSFIVIDHPQRPDIEDSSRDVPSLEDERAMNLRPYWRKVDPYDVIGWRSKTVGGVEMLTQVRIRENTSEPAGKFGEQTVQRVRVIEPGRFTVYELREEKWIATDTGQYLKADGSVLPYVPVVPFYTTLPNAVLNTTPTLLDLAYMNVLHWQSQSDQENILHVARVPVLFGSGFFDDDTLEIGSGRWIKGPEGSTLSYVEHSGAAIQAGREELEDIENRMRIMGAEILVRDPARVTATQKVLDSDEATSELQDIVYRYEDFLAVCYSITAEWMGLPPDAVGEIEIFKDFGISAQAVQEAQVLLQMRLAKQISQETFLRETQRRGILGEEVDVEAEAAVTEAESTSNMEAFNGGFGGDE